MSKIFISYSHQDEDWKERLQKKLTVLELEGYFTVWEDRRLKPGEKWQPAIKRELAQFDVAVTLISDDFLTSDFIRTEEVPDLLQRQEQKNVRIIPLILKPCTWQEIPWIKAILGGSKDNVEMSGLSEHDQDVALTNLARDIKAILHPKTTQSSTTAPTNPTNNQAPTTPSPTILSDRLPTVKGKFFGRDDELQLLDDAWNGGQSTIVEFVASGGTGKTKLLRHWLDHSMADKALGINAVIAWSFYSQGASEDKQISSRLFFDHALAKLGSGRTDFSSEEDRGEYLAEQISQRRCLLILDGLEPLQHAGAANLGELKDRALRQLLRILALNNQGLCVITTRIAVHELSDRQRQVVHHNLDNLKAADAVELLKDLQVQGTDKELRAAAKDYACHALSISLLGNLLYRRHGGDIRKRDLIPGLVDSASVDKDNRHAFKIMQAYEHWFSEDKQYSAELALLRLLGLFDHPIEQSVLAILQQAQIPQLTQGVDTNAWSSAIAVLRDEHHLLAQANNSQDDQLDCHPLIRAYFAHQLQSSAPKAWRAAHTKLYDYYKNLPPKSARNFAASESSVNFR